MFNILKKNLKKNLVPGLMASLICVILWQPELSARYTSTALKLWFENMIPALFPFMILSGIIIRCGYSSYLSIPFAPILRKIYHINLEMCTSILIGFLFGFPLGAKSIAEQYQLGFINRRQASYLLAFCNNIGLAYMTGFVLPLFRPYSILILPIHLFVPMLYGFILRFSIYKYDNFNVNASPNNHRMGFTTALDSSIYSSCDSIMKLGGYMILFMVSNLLVPSMYQHTFLGNIISMLLEITSGLKGSFENVPLPICCAFITFGGFSCIAQTYTCICKTDLSIKDYSIHKVIQGLMTLLCYFLCFLCFRFFF